MHFIPLKKEPNNYSKCSAFAYFALLRLYFCSNSVSLVEGGVQEYSLSQSAGYPSYATVGGMQLDAKTEMKSRVSCFSTLLNLTLNSNESTHIIA